MIEVSYMVVLARRAFLLCTLLLATCCAMHAQQPDGPPPDGPPPGAQGDAHRGFNVDRQLKHLTQLLSLTSDQQTQVKAILTEQKQQMDALRQSAQSEESPGAGREKRMAMRDQTNAKISEILNDQQKATFAAWEERQKAQMQRREQGDQPPPPPPDGGGGPPPGI